MLLNYHLYKLSSIRHYFTTEATKSAVNALLTFRLDYCNSLFVNLPASQIFRLQRIRNYTARLITRTSRYDHITPVLMGLHWLPIASRIHFKVLVFAYRCVNGLAPTYLSELLHIRTPDERLRKDYAPTLHQCITKKSIGESAFGTTASRLSNLLAGNINNSKTAQKI